MGCSLRPRARWARPAPPRWSRRPSPPSSRPTPSWRGSCPARTGCRTTSSLASDTGPVGAAARRHAAARHIAALRYRHEAALPFDVAAAPPLPVLLDTTVYLDRGRGRLPRSVRALIAARQHLVYNCGVVCAELAISIGLLDPGDARTPATAAAVHAHLDRMQTDKTVSPSSEAWTEAAVLAGVLARTQGLAVPKKDLTADQECCQR